MARCAAYSRASASRHLVLLHLREIRAPPLKRTIFHSCQPYSIFLLRIVSYLCLRANIRRRQVVRRRRSNLFLSVKSNHRACCCMAFPPDPFCALCGSLGSAPEPESAPFSSHQAISLCHARRTRLPSSRTSDCAVIPVLQAAH